MPKLTDAEKTEHRSWLSEWRTPSDMASYVHAMKYKMGSACFFRQGGLEFLRDAWQAAEFGQHRQSKAVRLVAEKEEWPDFEACGGDVIERVECVEADVPGRRRGNEYRQTATQSDNGQIAVTHDPEEDWIARAEQVPVALSAMIDKKIKKNYGVQQASLLVHLNIYEFGIRQAEIEAAMASAAAPVLPHFQRVWILWKARLHGPWNA